MLVQISADEAADCSTTTEDQEEYKRLGFMLFCYK